MQDIHNRNHKSVNICLIIWYIIQQLQEQTGEYVQTLIHREQWVGFDGRPMTTIFTGDMPIALLHGGVGLNIVQDQIGQFKDVDVKLEYAYHYNLGPGKLSIGGTIRIFQ